MDGADGLDRFVAAQADTFAAARAEIAAGRKRTHWMWFVYPQLRGLGRSARSDFYGLSGLDEARQYLAHPLLGPRLIDMHEALVPHHARGAVEVLGAVDAAKLRSHATLFARLPEAPALFDRTIAAFFPNPCPRTEAML